MSNQIRITPEQMRTRASEYRRQADAVHGVIDQMDRLLSQLQTEWEGKSSEAYANRYNELKPGFVKAEQLIVDIAQSLETIAKDTEERDANYASQFNG